GTGTQIEEACARVGAANPGRLQAVARSREVTRGLSRHWRPRRDGVVSVGRLRWEKNRSQRRSSLNVFRIKNNTQTSQAGFGFQELGNIYRANSNLSLP